MRIAKRKVIELIIAKEFIKPKANISKIAERISKFIENNYRRRKYSSKENSSYYM